MTPRRRWAMAVPLRSFGTYAVWFPRGLMLNLAARHACKRLIDQWIASDTLQSSRDINVSIHETVQRYLDHAELTTASLIRQVDDQTHAGATGEVGATPSGLLTSMLVKLEDQLMQSNAQEDPGNWGKQAMVRIRDWMGAGGDDQEFGEWRKTKLARALATTTQKLAEQWEQTVTHDVYDLMAFPGARVAGAEIALEMLHKHFQKAAEEVSQLYQQQMPKTALAWREAEKSLQECIHGSGGFRLFGGRSKTRQLRSFFEKLSQYLSASSRRTHRRARVLHKCRPPDDRVRDLGFPAGSFRHLQENLDRPMSDDDEELNGTRSLPVR